MPGWLIVILTLLGVAVLIAIRDVLQRKHAIIHNFPILGHFRYLLESIGPELRQYIVTSNNEERPFSRDQRRWVYASSKLQNNYFGFGTDNDLETCANHLVIKHSAFPHADPPRPKGDSYNAPCAKILGGWRNRRHAFRPPSIVNVSGMSFGSLSGPAVEALNRGCQLAGCLHNTGEGGVAPYHLNGGDLIWQIGTGYFGCRDEQGNFDWDKLGQATEQFPVRAIEIKLSQGAKPGLGGVLPQQKITAEIAGIRGIPRDRDCVSPSRHAMFSDVDSLIDFAEQIGEETGLPVGIKSAVGDMRFWNELAQRMASSGRGVDFVAIDGGEGGTGAAPLVFTDYVAFPFKVGFSRVFRCFVEAGLSEQVVFAGSGRLGFPDAALLAMGLGCDLIHVGREAMMAIGCIQAQRCHTGHCPTGVATQNKWLMSGLDPQLKSARLANYITTLRKEMLQIAHACGQPHPALMTLSDFDVLDENLRARPATQCFDYQPRWGLPSAADRESITEIMDGND